MTAEEPTAVPLATRAEIDHRAERGWWSRRRSTSTLVTGLVVVAVVVGIGVRLWLVFHDHTTSDEADIALIAEQILHGHTYAFNWGQSFGGVEPYVVAGFFWIFGHGPVTLAMTPVALSLVSALLVWRITRRLVRDPAFAVLAGALAWAAPFVAVYGSTVEEGYRGVTMTCGLGVVLVALRISDGRLSYREFVALGLLAGVGWWALPEIAYFLVPAALLVIGAVARTTAGSRLGRWAPRLGLGVVTFGIGALPWIWANIASGFASLDPSKFPGSATPLDPGYLGRLGTFFADALPLQLDLRRSVSGRWLFGVAGSGVVHQGLMVVVTVVVLAVVVLGVVLCASRGGRALAMAVSILAYPFLVAVQPGTWYWQDGRYTVYTGALLAIALAVGIEEGARRLGRPGRRSADRGDQRSRRFGRVAFGAVVACSVLLTLVDVHQSLGVGPASFIAGWSDPDHAARATVTALERHGIRTGYADYWIAYDADFSSGGGLELTVAGPDPDRWVALDRTVRASPHPAWLFVPPARMHAARAAFGDTGEIRGPSSLHEAAFLAMLDRRGIAYRVVDAGLVQAVEPARPVAPSLVSSLLRPQT